MNSSSSQITPKCYLSTSRNIASRFHRLLVERNSESFARLEYVAWHLYCAVPHLPYQYQIPFSSRYLSNNKLYTLSYFSSLRLLSNTISLLILSLFYWFGSRFSSRLHSVMNMIFTNPSISPFLIILFLFIFATKHYYLYHLISHHPVIRLVNYLLRNWATSPHRFPQVNE